MTETRSTAAADIQPGTMKALLAAPVRPGKLVWIGLRPKRQEPVVSVPTATLVASRGIEGDHYQTARDGARQVTVISAEEIAAIASYLGRDDVAPDILRRNLVVRGINLSALKGARFSIGPAVLEYSGPCAPCSHMEAALGTGGYNAVRNHGGITARIIEGGDIRIGDAVVRVD